MVAGRWDLTNGFMYPQESQITNVRAQIKEAFGFGLAKPPKVVVSSEGREGDDELQALSKDFTGREWWTIDYVTLNLHRDCICLFNEEGFYYYIPAFMLACLEFTKEEAHDVCSLVLMNLNPVNDEGIMVSMLHERFETFTDSQKKALALFIELFQGVEGLPGRQARASYDAYWKRHANTKCQP